MNRAYGNFYEALLRRTLVRLDYILSINSPAKYIGVLIMQHNHFLQGGLVRLFLRVRQLL